MTSANIQAIFTLDGVENTSRAILAAHPSAIVSYRLQREVLRLPASDAGLSQLKAEALKSKWVRQLGEAQLANGSWGRFHSQDTKTRTDFRTTEEAIDRAFALGLDIGDEILLKARGYILDVFAGNSHITDRAEKSESWPMLIKFIIAGRLAQVDPHNEILVPFWIYLAEVTQLAFASGEYRLEDETAALMSLSGIRVPAGFLESQHALWILSSRQLPEELESRLVNWIWHKADGIRYLRAPLVHPHPRLIGYWLRSMNLLTHFSAWRGVSVDYLNSLWEQCDENGLWDFGTNIAKCVDLPLSENWRNPNYRKFDYSTYLLSLLRKYHD